MRSGAFRRRAAWPLLAAVGLLALAGCGLFKPTEPEPPSGGVVRADYSSPENTLTTLRLAVEDKGTTTGLTAYLDGLASPDRDNLDFVAIALPSVVQALQGVVNIPDPWTHTNESGFYPRLIGIDPEPYAMQWAPDTRFDSDQVSDNDAVLNRSYRIQTSQNRLIARGYAKLTLRQTAPGRWVIVTWEEHDVEPGDTEDVTFSMLRLKP